MAVVFSGTTPPPFLPAPLPAPQCHRLGLILAPLFPHRGACVVTFLGTASSQPSKYRNVTALHVALGPGAGALLDCGEDSLGQLKRRSVRLIGSTLSVSRKCLS